MAVEIGPRFAPTWGGIPPHLSPEDLALWRRWRPLHERDYEGFHFDVRLITPQALPPDLEPNIRRMWLMNTAKRIDVLGVKRDRLDIIELRDNAGLSAIGQLLGYWARLSKEPIVDRPLHMLLVTNRLDPDVVEAARLHSIEVEIV